VGLIGNLIRRLDPISPDLSVRLTDLSVRYRWKRSRRLEQRIIDLVVSRGMSVVDIGASRGFFTLRYLQLVGATGHVMAVEPNPTHAADLQRIRRLYPNLIVQSVALSSEAGTGTLHVPVHDGMTSEGLASLVEHSGEQRNISVQIGRLDDLVAAPVDYIKCDVEGHEDHVIDGGTRTLASMPILQIEIEQRHRAAPIQATFDRIMAFGYGSGWALSDSRLMPLAEFDLERDQLAYTTGGFQEFMPGDYVNNFLFLPPGMIPPIPIG
jgi:FkbM family methyltransferase